MNPSTTLNARHAFRYKSYRLYFLNFYKIYEIFLIFLRRWCRISSKSSILRYYNPSTLPFNRIESTLLFSHCPMFHCQTKGTVHLLKPVEFQPQRNCSLGTTDSAVRSRRDIGRSIDRVAAGVGLISIPIARDLSRNVLSLAAAGPPFGEHVLRMRITAHTRITP